MKKGLFLSHAAVLLYQGVHAVPVNPSHPVEAHHAAASKARGFQQPDILSHMTEPHQQVIITEGLHSQKGAITGLSKNPNVVKTHVLYTGGEVQRKAMNSVHNYLVQSGVNPETITHSALQPHRTGTQSQEKNFAGAHDQGLTLHDWKADSDKLLVPGTKVNMHVTANVPAETVVDTINKAHKVGGSLGHVHHHDSGAAYRNNAVKELKDKHAIGEAVHKHDGTMVWSHRDHSWPKAGSAMTRSSEELREFNPHDHVKAAEEASTFPHNKALAVDRIGKAMDGDEHMTALRDERKVTKTDQDYVNTFNAIRKSTKKDGEVAKDLDHIRNWVPKSSKMLDQAHKKAMEDEHFAKTVATPELIAKHKAHIDNKEEYIGSLEKPGMQLEWHDAHLQGALVEAAHNKNGNPKNGAHFVPVRHEIQPDKRVKAIPLDHVEAGKATHWQMVNANADSAFHNAKQMHQGKHEQLFKDLAAKNNGEGPSTS